MLRWLSFVCVGSVLSVFAFLLVTGDYINEGGVVVTVSHTHGVHEGDLYVVAGWALAMVALLVLVLVPARRAPR